MATPCSPQRRSPGWVMRNADLMSAERESWPSSILALIPRTLFLFPCSPWLRLHPESTGRIRIPGCTAVAERKHQPEQRRPTARDCPAIERCHPGSVFGSNSGRWPLFRVWSRNDDHGIGALGRPESQDSAPEGLYFGWHWISFQYRLAFLLP